jgi:hypothetical protein
MSVLKNASEGLREHSLVDVEPLDGRSWLSQSGLNG